MSTRRDFLHQLGAGLAATGALTGAATPLPSPGREPDDESYWRHVASEFVIDPEIAYLNTGTRGPSPRSVIRAQVDAIYGVDRDRLSYASFVDNSDYRTRLRERLAAFVGVKPTEMALTNNTTEGMAFGTSGIDLSPGDEIVCTNHDHSSGGQPINLRQARDGIRTVMVDLARSDREPPRSSADVLEAFDRAIGPRTRLVSFCHVNYTDGMVMPVREICELARSRGALTLVDGAHPPGMMDLDIDSLGCDMYAGACHKWMLASMLTGFFTVREDVQDRVWPTVYSGHIDGKNMLGGAVDDPDHSLARFESRGSKSSPNAASIDAAIDFHEAIGPAAIEARDRHLAARLIDGLSAIGGVHLATAVNEFSCGLVAFKLPGVETKEMNDLLWDRHRIYVRNVTKPEIGFDVNRASLHIMVTAADVDRLIGAVADIARERAA